MSRWAGSALEFALALAIALETAVAARVHVEEWAVPVVLEDLVDS